MAVTQEKLTFWLMEWASRHWFHLSWSEAQRRMEHIKKKKETFTNDLTREKHKIFPWLTAPFIQSLKITGPGKEPGIYFNLKLIPQESKKYMKASGATSAGFYFISPFPERISTSPLKKRKELPAKELSKKSSISTDSWSICGGTCSTDTH